MNYIDAATTITCYTSAIGTSTGSLYASISCNSNACYVIKKKFNL